MRIIGLDIGEKRIGVAKADSGTRIAVPVGFIEVNGTEWDEIAKVARLNSTNFFVLGLPRSNEGNETKQSLYARNFAKTLSEKIPGVKIRFQDESLTSVVAEERLKSRKKKYEKGDIDAEAASIILQDFIENFTVGMAKKEQDEEKPKINESSSVAADVKAAMTEASETVSNLTKKKADRMKLNTRKAKHKMKKMTKIVSIVVIIAILGLLATGGALLLKEIKARERAEEYARQEAAMQAKVFSFTILPGETIFDVRDKLVELGYSVSEVDEALNANYNYSFLKNRPEGATLEGYLYGETHEFYEDTSAKEIIETFLKGTDKVIKDNKLEEKYAARGLSLFEGITLASIVQKEAPSEEQPTVAQVFLSRLSYGVLLGSDVTVSYALDVLDPERQVYADNQAALTIDSCYNTRLYAGLPCGPISNPGLSALLAVANPSDTAYLYFLTGDDGLMYYGYTEAEHIQNIYSHCQNLCNASL